MTTEFSDNFNKNVETILRVLPANMHLDYQVIDEEDFITCPQCEKYCPKQEILTDGICWHCIRKEYPHAN